MAGNTCNAPRGCFGWSRCREGGGWLWKLWQLCLLKLGQRWWWWWWQKNISGAVGFWRKRSALGSDRSYSSTSLVHHQNHHYCQRPAKSFPKTQDYPQIFTLTQGWRVIEGGLGRPMAKVNGNGFFSVTRRSPTWLMWLVIKVREVKIVKEVKRSDCSWRFACGENGLI